jgi:photosynthetic reaction center H subunit
MSGTGAITGYIDVAQLVLYAFWIFFAGLVYYLRREDKREGYPLDPHLAGRGSAQGFPAMPDAKTFTLAGGGTVSAPSGKSDMREIKAKPVAPWPGAPLEPTGDPMVDAVGPASYAERADKPDVTVDGKPKIVPLRLAPDFHLESRDPDPRGMSVIGADGEVGGKVTDAWVDRSETVVRYLEVDTGTRHVLLPINFAKVDGRRGVVRVRAIRAHHFALVPATKSADHVTFLEEDKIMGFYGGGTLYAEPSRMGPLL